MPVSNNDLYEEERTNSDFLKWELNLQPTIHNILE